MKIAYDHQIFVWQKYGGISRYFTELASRIGKMQEVSVVSPVYVNEYLSNNLNYKLIGKKIIPFPRLGFIYHKLYQFKVKSILSNLKPDIVHETYFNNFRCAPKNSATVLTVFDMIDELYPSHSKISAYIKILKKRAVEKSDNVICISENTRNDMLNRYRLDENKVSVISLGFELPIFEAPKICEYHEKKYLLFVGKRKDYKNFSVILDAFRNSSFLRNEFKIVCFGGGEFNSEEKYLIRTMPDNFKIEQINGSDQVLVGLYKFAEALIYPSKYEGFGIPILEAMSLDCPVICSNTSSLPEVAGDAALYFNPDDPLELALKLENLLGNADIQKSLIEKGRKQKQKFSWDKCAEETLNVYRKLL